MSVLSDWGLMVRTSISNDEGSCFAGKDDARYRNLQKQLDDPDIKAIISARGGYGTTRIIDRIDLTEFNKSPKWVIGYSDITVLLQLIQQAGYQAIHGPMAIHLSEKKHSISVEKLKSLLFGEKQSYRLKFNQYNRLGNGNGTLTGGNLSMICNSLGTSTEIDTIGKILFIEEVHEYLYAIDRMMVQLKRSGKLKNLSGLCIGQFTDLLQSDPPFEKTTEEIILEHVLEYDYPICFGISSGHGYPNYPMIFGGSCNLIVNQEYSNIEF